MYQAGTLSGNPLAMTAGLVTIRTLLEGGMFDAAAGLAEKLVAGVEAAAADAGIPVQAAQAGTMFGFYFLKDAGARITDYDSAKAYADTERYARFYHAMLARGVYLAPSQFEAGFVSSAHTPELIDETLDAVRAALTA